MSDRKYLTILITTDIVVFVLALLVPAAQRGVQVISGGPTTYFGRIIFAELIVAMVNIGASIVNLIRCMIYK